MNVREHYQTVKFNIQFASLLFEAGRVGQGNAAMHKAETALDKLIEYEDRVRAEMKRRVAETNKKFDDIDMGVDALIGENQRLRDA